MSAMVAGLVPDELEVPDRLGADGQLEWSRASVEWALSWLSCYRRPQVRWVRDSGRFLAFVLLAWALVCGTRLRSPSQAGGLAVVAGSYN
jgi:hypothetical protein